MDMDLATFMKKYPHNTDCEGSFFHLVEIAYRKDKSGYSLEDFIDNCLNCYGGTVAGALIEYLYNTD